jgi:predicted Zn-dependent peptidase
MKIELPNGITVVAERVPTARSVSIGVWVPVGSRDEDDAHAGQAHFIEHLVFKGTKTRSALDISREIDAVGGDLNAFTGKEMTCYYARVLDEFFPKAIELLADITCNASFDAAEIETERQVVFEEIRASLDDAASCAHDFFNEVFWGGHSLGRPISGTVDTVASLDRDSLLERFMSVYGAGSMVVAAAGNLDPGTIGEAIHEAFGDLRRAVPTERIPPRSTESVFALQKRSSEEAHIFIGVEGISRDDPRRYALMYLNQILGGSMSSRLFQEIRERRGLAYTTYSFSDQYQDGGCYGVYAATAAERAGEALAVLRDELTRMSSGEITEEEFEIARGHISGMLVLGDEDSGSKMSRLGRSQLVLGYPLTLEELLSETSAVTADEVSELAKQLLDGAGRTTVVVGPFEYEDGERLVDSEKRFIFADSHRGYSVNEAGSQ